VNSWENREDVSNIFHTTMWAMFGYQNSGTVFHSIGILEHLRDKHLLLIQAIGKATLCVM
jgi:hypothetical protein|tara:strand:- start:919 stop:1098 length:180 start_codon:yes stop_codon:yes gene_type:complete